MEKQHHAKRTPLSKNIHDQITSFLFDIGKAILTLFGPTKLAAFIIGAFTIRSNEIAKCTNSYSKFQVDVHIQSQRKPYA